MRPRSSLWPGFLAALAFASLLLSGSLSSSDFPRTLFQPPAIADSQHFSDFAALHPNLVPNDHADYTTFSTWMDLLGRYNLKSILTAGQWQQYLVMHYSQGQAMRYEAEWTLNNAQTNWAVDGDQYYWFSQWEGREDNPFGIISWKVDPALDDAGLAFKGPNHATTSSNESGLGFEWMDYPYPDTTDLYRVFMHRMSARALPGGLSPQDTVFQWFLECSYWDTLHPGYPPWSLPVDTVTVTANMLTGQFQLFEMTDTMFFHLADLDSPYTAPPYRRHASNLRFAFYRVYWTDLCETWFDYIESMDTERGYYLFGDPPGSTTLRDATLGDISRDCSTLENGQYANRIAFWQQADTPPRMSFRAHGLVHDRLGANHPPAAAVPCVYHQGRSD
ncbi:MAG: hypothetical protein C4524_10360 [Candidatus Zixiibacteriota bacterium]|nr:MAG: hypothetical protein C4524_10360 [candidate division Zixibacteria bacterium]